MEFRKVKNFDNLEIARDGTLRDSVTKKLNHRTIIPTHGYLSVYRKRSECKKYRIKKSYELLHRLVAEAWIENHNPKQYTIINHKDGNPKNNHADNLEWCDHGWNNLHAASTGMKKQTIKGCRVRNIFTGEIIAYNSINDAKRLFGWDVRRDNKYLVADHWGKVFNNRWEFKFPDDDTPWFYEGREPLIIKSTRRMVITCPNGSTVYAYTIDDLWRQFPCSVSDYIKYRQDTFENVFHHYYPKYKYTWETFELPDRTKGDKKRLPTQILGVETSILKPFIFESYYQAHKLTNCDKRLIREAVNNLKIVKNRSNNDKWMFADLSNLDACNELLDHLSVPRNKVKLISK